MAPAGDRLREVPGQPLFYDDNDGILIFDAFSQAILIARIGCSFRFFSLSNDTPIVVETSQSPLQLPALNAPVIGDINHVLPWSCEIRGQLIRPLTN